MKRLWWLGGLLLLAGCAHDQARDAGSARPEAMFKVLDTPESVTYFAANSLALYQNNPHLRQFYLINNYSKPTDPGDSKPLIHSSRVVRIINCERDESAQLGRVYFSEPFAQGAEVMRKEAHAQWAAFPRQSVIGELRNMACGIDAARLGAPPFKGPQGD